MRIVSVVSTTLMLLGSAYPSTAGTFLQLKSTLYPGSDGWPAEARRPEPGFGFVAKGTLPAGAKVLSAAKAAGDAVWVLTDKGPFQSAAPGAPYEPLEVGPRVLEPGQSSVDPSTEINQIVGDPLGHIWLATSRGVFVSDAKQWWQPITRKDGVPYEAVNCLHLAPNGDVWGGTREGAWRLRDGEFRYFWGRRWLPGNAVRAIWSGDKGDVWVETDGGLAHLEEVPMTLAQKADHYDRIVQERHNRRGFIHAIRLAGPGRPADGSRLIVSANDGIWTSLYAAAMSFRYAATKDPAAKAQASESINAVLDLERLSGIPGYATRCIVTDEDVRTRRVDSINFDAKVASADDDSKIWFRSRTRPDVRCKGDTSSDALAGPYFAWYVYHDLVADEAEKKEIAAVVRRVTDRIVDSNLVLIGHNGKKTRWGIWAPELINHHPFYYDLRALNSLEILAFLKVASHITGDARYDKVADNLIEKHHYLLNTLMMRRGEPGHWATINHSDDELLYLVYYPLLMLEKAPARRRILVQSIARTWEGSGDEAEQPIRPEHNSFYNFTYGATTGRRCDTDEAAQTLRDWPWELVDWTTYNSQRDDVRLRTAPGLRENFASLDRVLPSSERRQARLNTSPWLADGEGNGTIEHDGVIWTLGYWLGVHHEYLRVAD